MTIAAVDASGNVATGFRGTVYISSSDPAATTAAGYAFNPADAGIPYTFTAADNGSHTFTGAIRLVTGGNQTVTVSAPNMTPASATVTVTGAGHPPGLLHAVGRDRRGHGSTSPYRPSTRKGTSRPVHEHRSLHQFGRESRATGRTTPSPPPTPARTPSASP